MSNETSNTWKKIVGDLSEDGRTLNELWHAVIEQLQALVHDAAQQQNLTVEQKAAFRAMLTDVRLLYVGSEEQAKLHSQRLTELVAMEADLLAARMESEKLRARIRYDFLQLRTIRKIAGDALSGGRGVRDDGA